MVELKSKETELYPKEGRADIEALDQMPNDSTQEISLKDEIEAIFEEFDDLFKELADR